MLIFQDIIPYQLAASEGFGFLFILFVLANLEY